MQFQSSVSTRHIRRCPPLRGDKNRPLQAMVRKYKSNYIFFTINICLFYRIGEKQGLTMKIHNVLGSSTSRDTFALRSNESHELGVFELRAGNTCTLPSMFHLQLTSCYMSRRVGKEGYTQVQLPFSFIKVLYITSGQIIPRRALSILFFLTLCSGELN
jgi:hypothetical protein